MRWTSGTAIVLVVALLPTPGAVADADQCQPDEEKPGPGAYVVWHPKRGEQARVEVEQRRSFDNCNLTGPAALDDGRVVWVGPHDVDENATIHVWDDEEGRDRSFQGPQARGIGLYPVGRSLFSTHGHSPRPAGSQGVNLSLTQLDLETGQRRTVANVPVNGTVLSGDRVFLEVEVVNTSAPLFSVYDVARQSWILRDRPIDFTLQGDGWASKRFVAYPGADGRILVHDIAANETRQIELGDVSRIAGIEGSALYWTDPEGIVHSRNLASGETTEWGDPPGRWVLDVDGGPTFLTSVYSLPNWTSRQEERSVSGFEAPLAAGLAGAVGLSFRRREGAA